MTASSRTNSFLHLILGNDRATRPQFCWEDPHLDFCSARNSRIANWNLYLFVLMPITLAGRGVSNCILLNSIKLLSSCWHSNRKEAASHLGTDAHRTQMRVLWVERGGEWAGVGGEPCAGCGLLSSLSFCFGWWVVDAYYIIKNY